MFIERLSYITKVQSAVGIARHASYFLEKEKSYQCKLITVLECTYIAT